MTSFDIFVFVVLGFSLIFSLMKGFVREIFSLLSYVGGYLMAVKYQSAFSQVLMESIPSKPISKLVAFVGIYIIAAIIISLIGRVIKAILWSGTDMSMFDRVIGGIVGLAKGVAILIAVMFPLQLFPEVAKKITLNSYTAPHLVNVLEFINNNYGNLNIRKKILDFDIQGAKNKFDELKDLKKLTEKYQDLKESLPNDDKPLEQYLKDDRNKLNELLKAVDKN